MLFNEERKRQFLRSKTYNVVTERKFWTVFKRVSIHESLTGKDIVEFDMKELEELFYAFKCKTYMSIRTIGAMLRQYVYWEVQNGWLPSKNIVLDLPGFMGSNLMKFMNVRGMEFSYIRGRDELYRLVSCVENPRDKAIICLLYEGVCGEDYGEIRNLKRQDCDFSLNRINIYYDDISSKNRSVQCDARTMSIVMDSLDTDRYHMKNGKAERKYNAVELLRSDYVIRTSKNTGISTSKLYTMLFERLRTPGWGVDYYCQYLTPITVRNSGMFNKLLEFERDNGRAVTNDEFGDMIEYYSGSRKALMNFKVKYVDFKNRLETKVN